MTAAAHRSASRQPASAVHGAAITWCSISPAPGCHHRYQILTTDTELRQTVQQHKKIAAKIRMGQSKNFRPETLKKYQAEMKKLEAEQKKRRDELMDKGNEILAQLGEE